MDSTPSQCQPPLSIKPSATKLPIKRKTPNPSPILCNDVVSPEDAQSLDPKTQPFKFHRIWTEPDELRFLQGLLDCAANGLSFPKDLHLFYARFSATISQSYTRSQLSEKLRRLRRKFRVVSARLARGLRESQLSEHDRALYDVSRKLWSPECWSTSPFGNKAKGDAGDDNLVVDENVDQNQSVSDDVYVENDLGEEVKTSELSRPIAGLAAKAVLDVFDQSLNEVRMVLVQQGLHCPDPVGPGSSNAPMDFERQWQLQRLAELDVLAQRLRLVFDSSIRGQ